MYVWVVTFHYKYGDEIEVFDSKETLLDYLEVLEYNIHDDKKLVFKKSLCKTDDREYYVWYLDGKGGHKFDGVMKCVFQKRN